MAHEPGEGDRTADPASAYGALSSRATRRARLMGTVVGLLLVGGAVFAVFTRRDALSGGVSALGAAPVWAIALGAALPILSVLLASVTFWILTTRYGRVGRGEMFALIGSAWLLNYLPMWPGMIGRLTYHKAVNGIPVRDAAKAIIWANALNLLGAAALLCAVGLGAAFFNGDDAGFLLLALAPAPVVMGLAAYARAKRPAPDPEVWRVLAALAVRYVELHVHALRAYVCFALVGAPIAWGGALAIACCAGLAAAVNLAPNGLGVREWVVGLVAPALPTSLTRRADLHLAQGLSADLVNRALEVIVAIPVGLACAAWLAQRIRNAPPAPDA